MRLVSKAKNFVLIPEKSSNAIVIRRGPAKHVGIFSWNLKTSEIKVSQWVKGRVYEYYSDVSADGKLFMYSANKGPTSYTVISKAPWLKALSLWKNVGGCGGGLLVNNRNYILFDGSESYREFHTSNLTGMESDKNLRSSGIYPERLSRFDWELVEETKELSIFRKQLGRTSFIEKLWHKWQLSSGSNKPSLWESHRLTLDGVTTDMEDWEWSEVYKSKILWSENGCLYEKSIKDFRTTNKPKLIYDFNNEKIQELVAPY
ncbi:MAG: hypothetical protein ABJI60_19990 [Kangiellaceae bacterium]